MGKYLAALFALCLIACADRGRAVFNQAQALYQQQQYAQALPLFQQATALGDLKASRYIGLSYLHGEGVEKDPVKAFDAFQVAAERGDITSQYWLGYLYEQGIGTEKDLAQAVVWYKRSAQRGDHISQPAIDALKRLQVN